MPSSSLTPTDPAPQGDRKGPLSHLRVLDMSRVLAGPWAGQIFADLGAEVIKIERPGAGDDTRAWGPPFLTGRDGAETRESGYYLCANRGKKSVTVNIATPEGQAIIRDLAARSDVLLENYRTGTLQRYGLDYAALSALNPGLVYCSLTGFGQTGPRAHQVAYDFLIQAMGGIMSITGEEDGRPGGGPQKIGVPMVDLASGLYLAVGALAALARRAVTGQGDYLDLAMLDVQVNLLANQAMNHLLTGTVPRRYGNGHPNIMPQQVFACRDGAMVLAVGNDEQYARLAEVLGDPVLAEPRFARNRDRVRQRDELLDRLAGLFAPCARAEVLARLDAAKIPAGPINSVAEALAEPQVQARGLVARLPHPLAGEVTQILSPLKFRHAGQPDPRSAPPLGADTGPVLESLGLSPETLAGLRARGAI
ncbi:CaiB/BaiF CoA transferase family protein [Xinfangfangia pollutisoli]|uniref:CaiB/BaiF CoA transferase family protein n=1 Tax=Xinfangfangia pollutisoli TaxID=2865960 RepID=UPI001CD44175|nr:CaiB/BaiF CoA-transferase family protein [Xinfangfangia pollutisoli]